MGSLVSVPAPGGNSSQPPSPVVRVPDTIVDVVPPRPVRRLTIPAAISPVLQLPNLDVGIWVLAAVRFVVTAGFAVVMPFLAMHLVVDRGFSVLRIGGLWAMSSAGCAAMQWVAGHLAERI